MKDEVLAKLRDLEERCRKLRAEVKKLSVSRVSRVNLRSEAEALADYWVEEVRSHLEHDFALETEVIAKYAANFKRLHVLSRPNNLAKSYVDCLSAILQDYKDDLVLPIQQATEPAQRNPTLRALLRRVPDNEISAYLTEAIGCAEAGFSRGAIVLGWCAAVARIHAAVERIGLDKFSQATVQMKNATSGRFKDFRKEYKVTTLSELQDVPEGDLVKILEGMGLIDSNQGDRLRTCLQYRKQSAHPGQAPIGEIHLAPFFSDLIDIVLLNPKLAVS